MLQAEPLVAAFPDIAIPRPARPHHAHGSSSISPIHSSPYPEPTIGRVRSNAPAHCCDDRNGELQTLYGDLAAVAVSRLAALVHEAEPLVDQLVSLCLVLVGVGHEEVDILVEAAQNLTGLGQLGQIVFEATGKVVQDGGAAGKAGKGPGGSCQIFQQPLGLRTDSRGDFANYADNFQLDGVWRCPSAKRQESGDTLERLNESGRSYFRLDYSYIGRVDLWDDVMFQRSQTRSVDKGALVGKFPASGRIMLTDTVFYWDVGDAEETIYIYNHGKNGPSGWSNTSGSYFQPPRDIEGMNQAFGDGSVEWKKIDSDDRFKSDGFAGRKNRYTFMGYSGYLFY